MFEITLSDNYKQFAAGIDDFAKRHLPFATSRALTETAKLALADVKTEMQRVFDQPTPFTMNAFYVKPSTRQDLSAFVGIRSFAGKGTPAWKYLQAEQTGGPRNQKRFEKAFAINGAGNGIFALPTRDTPLDGYGNVNQGLINQILAALRAGGEGGISEAKTRRLRKQGLIAPQSVGGASNFFVKYRTDGTAIGVFQVMGGQGKSMRIRPVFWIDQKAPVYEPIFDFPATVQRSIDRHFMAEMEKYFKEAVDNPRGTKI